MKGQERPEDANRASNPVSRTVREGEKVIRLIKNALWLYSELCFLCRRGAHFQKIHEKMLPGSEKGNQNYVRYIKIPPRWGWIHEDGVKKCACHCSEKHVLGKIAKMMTKAWRNVKSSIPNACDRTHNGKQSFQRWPINRKYVFSHRFANSRCHKQPQNGCA